jgi:uncharacterized protein
MATIFDLDSTDISALLSRSTVGRLAYERGGRIAVVPVNFVYREGAIYGRTAANGKLDFLEDEAEVCFEVDEIRSGRDWRSVLVHGSFEIVRRNESEEDWLRALGAVRRLQGQALRERDPFPERTEVFRIIVREATGKAMA